MIPQNIIIHREISLLGNSKLLKIGERATYIQNTFCGAQLNNVGRCLGLELGFLGTQLSGCLSKLVSANNED